jgi:hypothetical protein
MVIAALEVNGKCAVTGYLHGWMSNLATRLNCSGKGCFDVLHKPIGPHYRLLGLTQGCAHAYHAAAHQCGGACIAEPRIRLTELHRIRGGVCSAHCTYVSCHYFQILNLHDLDSPIVNELLAAA